MKINTQEQHLKLGKLYSISGVNGNCYYIGTMKWEEFGNKEFHKFIKKKFDDKENLESVLVVSIPTDKFKLERNKILVPETEKILYYRNARINPLLRVKKYFDVLNKILEEQR